MIFKLIRRARLKKKPSKFMSTYDFCLVNKSSHRKSVKEKIGRYNMTTGSFELNVFRLIYWVSKDAAATGNTLKLLQDSGILKI